uniref:Uncharacterized protein n=1 Tax=viral metagenome TaxID=1070528 RepID=A0A6C0K6R0_9ZZZZ
MKVQLTMMTMKAITMQDSNNNPNTNSALDNPFGFSFLYPFSKIFFFEKRV